MAMNSEITSFRVPTSGATGKATRYAAIARVVYRLGGVKDPRHACKLFARKPGDPGIDRTRLIEFGRFANENRAERSEGKPATFDFLGFTHICAKKRNGKTFAPRRKTIAKKLRAKIAEVSQLLMRGRHRLLPKQGSWLKSVVQGHFNYYGVPGNRKAMDAFRTLVNRAWIRALRRRSHKARSLTWAKFQKLVKRWIPSARIVHPYPDQRFCV